MQSIHRHPSRSSAPRRERRLVLGIPFTSISAPAALEQCLSIVRRGEPKHVITANTDFLAKAEADPSVRRLMFEADEVYCDGMPLVWASRLFERPGGGLPERVTGSDLVPRLLDRLAAEERSVFFLGSDPETLGRLTEKLGKEIPSLRVAGAMSPPVGPIDGWDSEAIVEAIRANKPDVLMVAVGFPKQDEWIRRHRERLRVPLMIGVGASLDFIAGKQVRAPGWMQVSGLEWVWRLATDPKRLAKRYLDDFQVLARVIIRQLRATLRNYLPVWGARPGMGQALINGLRLGGVRVIRWESGGRVSETAGADRAGVVFDVSNVEAMEEGLIDALHDAARSAREQGRRFAIFGACPRLRSWLGDFGLLDVWPHFETPTALSTWLGEGSLSVALAKCGRRGIAFEKAIEELFAPTWQPGPERLRVDFQSVGSLNRLGANRLHTLKSRARAGGSSLVFENLSELTRDSLEILELAPQMAA